jgi:hypothetical protein
MTGSFPSLTPLGSGGIQKMRKAEPAIARQRTFTAFVNIAILLLAGAGKYVVAKTVTFFSGASLAVQSRG